MASVLSTFEKWKDFLGDRVQNARATGLNDTTIANLAVEIGNFLSGKVDPKTEEERVLKELWDVSDENEKKVLAGIMVKLVD